MLNQNGLREIETAEHILYCTFFMKCIKLCYMSDWMESTTSRALHLLMNSQLNFVRCLSNTSVLYLPSSEHMQWWRMRSLRTWETSQNVPKTWKSPATVPWCHDVRMRIGMSGNLTRDTIVRPNPWTIISNYEIHFSMLQFLGDLSLKQNELPPINRPRPHHSIRSEVGALPESKNR